MTVSIEALMEKLHQVPFAERLERIRKIAGLESCDLNLLSGKSQIPIDMAESLIENVIGYFPVPFGVATYFRIDGRDVLIPMAVEETSIIAAASATAKWVRQNGEITTAMQGRLIIGQIQIPRCPDPAATQAVIEAKHEDLIARCNALIPGLVGRGGGVKEVAVRRVPRADGDGEMVVLHVLCDPCEAMGANLINQVCEGLKPEVERLTGQKVGLCILSNLVDGKLATAEVVIRKIDPEVALGIQEAAHFAESDPYRAATHNKGILNGIDPILLATGNDWRAAEAGIHAYAARSGSYRPLSEWKYEDGRLIGRICLPMAVGVVGGVTKIHPMARLTLKILGVSKAEELARICAAVGLVQNLGALRALSTIGIVRGHMSLHTTNLAIAAGAVAEEVYEVSRRLKEAMQMHPHVSVSRAEEILKAIRLGGGIEDSRAR